MRPHPIPEDLARKIWDVLVEHVGASDGDSLAKDGFLHCAVEGTWTEYRFMGSLGFGGKVWSPGATGGKIFVNCYPEDETPAREAAMAAANAALAKIYSESSN